MFLTSAVYGQEDFTITANGLKPPLRTSTFDHLSASELYEKTLTWIEENEEEYKLSVVDQTEHQSIQFASTKWNATNLGDKYYIAEYSIQLIFEENSYQFEPTAIRLKLNSKYDMGWEEFDLTDGVMYFKKGKAVKKYKSYLDDITTRFNNVNLRLKAHFIKSD